MFPDTSEEHVISRLIESPGCQVAFGETARMRVGLVSARRLGYAIR